MARAKSYDYQWFPYGAISIFEKDSIEQVNFLQGDEANTLMDEIDNTKTDRQIQNLLREYATA